MPIDKNIAKIAKIVATAGTDSDLARRSAGDPRFRGAVQQDRRKALSRFETVQQALADRAKAARAKAAKAKAAKARKKR